MFPKARSLVDHYQVITRGDATNDRRFPRAVKHCMSNGG